MSVNALVSLSIVVRERLENNVLAASQKVITHDALNRSTSYNANTDPPASKMSAVEVTLVAGVASIDLTSLPATGGGTFDATGLKVRAALMINPEENANPLVIEPGDTNPYLLFGADFKVPLAPGQEHGYDLIDAAPAVGPTSKLIKLSDGGVGGTESHQVLLLMG
jgi:hypothetical protein